MCFYSRFVVTPVVLLRMYSRTLLTPMHGYTQARDAAYLRSISQASREGVNDDVYAALGAVEADDEAASRFMNTGDSLAEGLAPPTPLETPPVDTALSDMAGAPSDMATAGSWVSDINPSGSSSIRTASAPGIEPRVALVGASIVEERQSDIDAAFTPRDSAAAASAVYSPRADTQPPVNPDLPPLHLAVPPGEDVSSSLPLSGMVINALEGHALLTPASLDAAAAAEAAAMDAGDTSAQLSETSAWVASARGDGSTTTAQLSETSAWVASARGDDATTTAQPSETSVRVASARGDESSTTATAGGVGMTALAGGMRAGDVSSDAALAQSAAVAGSGTAGDASAERKIDAPPSDAPATQGSVSEVAAEAGETEERFSGGVLGVAAAAAGVTVGVTAVAASGLLSAARGVYEWVSSPKSSPIAANAPANAFPTTPTPAAGTAEQGQLPQQTSDVASAQVGAFTPTTPIAAQQHSQETDRELPAAGELPAADLAAYVTSGGIHGRRGDSPVGPPLAEGATVYDAFHNARFAAERVNAASITPVSFTGAAAVYDAAADPGGSGVMQPPVIGDLEPAILDSSRDSTGTAAPEVIGNQVCCTAGAAALVDISIAFLGISGHIFFGCSVSCTPGIDIPGSGLVENAATQNIKCSKPPRQCIPQTPSYVCKYIWNCKSRPYPQGHSEATWEPT